MDDVIVRCIMEGRSVEECAKERCVIRNMCLIQNVIEQNRFEVRRTNLQELEAGSPEVKKKMLTKFFTNWAEIGDSYIYDLTRVKRGMSIGTVGLDDFVEWDEKRIEQLVDELVDWMMQSEEPNGKTCIDFNDP